VFQNDSISLCREQRVEVFAVYGSSRPIADHRL